MRQMRLVDHRRTDLTATTAYKVWCATDTTAVLSNAATITPGAQVYSAQLVQVQQLEPLELGLLLLQQLLELKVKDVLHFLQCF